MLPLLFVDLMKGGVGDLCDLTRAVLEGSLDSIVESVREVISLAMTELFGRERRLDGKDAQDIHLEGLEVLHRMVRVDEDTTSIIERIHHIHLDALTHQSMTATLIDDFTLGVHHVIVLEESLTDTEVILLDLLLCTLYGLVEHAVLKDFSFLEAKTIHHRS